MSAALGIFDTATQRVEPVDLSEPFRLYVCGITPYDTTHLGHAFTYLSFDLLARYLRFLGVDVTYVQNVTDIDDDILIRAHAVGIGWRELGDRETRKFIEDMDALHWQRPSIVKATDRVGAMHEVIARLLELGYAYRSGGSVYFEVAKDARFAKRLCDLEYQAALVIANERGNFPEDEHKRDPLDFVLWQAPKEGEPAWESPWGPGRPGWHIECSAVSTTCLERPITVHGGGADLRFPHHEAEISQSEPTGDAPFVRHWMHTGTVYAEEHKMSKSLGNMVFVRDLLRDCSPDALRLYALSHHWRHDWNYEAHDLRTWADVAEELRGRLGGADGGLANEEAARAGRSLLDALADDLDGPAAIEALRSLSDGDGGSRSAARVLGREVLGLTFGDG